MLLHICVIQDSVLFSCTLQVPINYVLDIVNISGSNVASSGMKVAIYSDGNIITEQFTSGLKQNNTYSVRLTITHSQLPGQVVVNKNGIGTASNIDNAVVDILKLL